MKITPVSSGGPSIAGISMSNQGVSPDRLANAKAIASGEGMQMRPSETPIDPGTQHQVSSVRRLKMQTNMSPDRAQPLLDAPEISATEAASDGVETEVTVPLDPQAAALAKHRRALQVREREIASREKALLERASMDVRPDLAAQLKGDTLSVLKEQGLLTPEFYNSFTDFLVSGGQAQPDAQALKSQIMADVEKTLTTRDEQVRSQVLSDVRRDAEMLARDGDLYELIRGENAIEQVVDLIDRTFRDHRVMLSTQEAMELVETELLEANIKRAQFKKVQAKLKPDTPIPPETPEPRQMRTLTNRDTAQPPPMDRRTRMMLAALNQLKGN